MTERRIEELSRKIGNSLTDEVEWTIIEETLRECADEQKAIDKRLILDAYCKRCLDMCGGYPCSHKCYEYLEFEKTLEE